LIPFEKSRLLLPPNEKWELADPVWIDDDTVSFYVPTWFNPDSFIEGLNVNTCDNDDYVNIYLYYNTNKDEIRLIASYINASGYNEDHNDFDITVELDDESKRLFKEMIRNTWNKIPDDEEDSR